MTPAKGELSGHRIVLTGATGGIGRAVAGRLAGGGAELALIGRRAVVLDELAARLGAASFSVDVTDADAVDALPSRIAELWGEGAPNVLVNNAGVFDLTAFADANLALFDQHLAVNLRAPFQLIRGWLPDMLRNGAGHIVNVGSVAGRRAFAGNVAYSASKFGLRGLHEVLVEELRGTGVRATWIEPAAVDTSLWDPIDPDAREDLPSRDMMLRPEAVADAVYFAIAQPQEVAVEEIAIKANYRAERH